jgi:hypothetical protein
MSAKKKPSSQPAQDHFVQRHLLIGWLGLLVFLSLGMLLEVLHGLKLELYLDVRNATRRLMWTLAHAHGTLFSLVNVAFAATIPRLKSPPTPTASICYLGATVLLPLGFLLGGIWLHGGDPGLGILLVPIGAVFMLVAVLLTLRSLLGAGSYR